LKKVLSVFLVAVLVLALGVFSVSAMEMKGNTMVLKAACDHPKGYPTIIGLEAMAEFLDQKTDGRIKVEIYPGAVLGSEKESIEQTQMGIIDINRVSIAPVTSIYKPISVFALPYIFRSREHEFKVLDGEIGEKMLTDLAPTGFVGLDYMDSGARSFYTVKKQIRTPADVKGLKVRVQKSPVMIAMVEALGGKPVPMAFEEVYTALQSGVIDGAENNAPSYESTKHYEVAKYYSLDGHARVPEIVLMSKLTWDKLSAADKKLMKEAGAVAEKAEKTAWLAREEKAMEIVKAAGCTIYTPDPAPFQKAMEPVYKEYGSEFGDLIKAIQDVK